MLMAKAQLQDKGMAISVEKAACFETNNFKNILTKELDTLLDWYDIPKEKMKKACASNTPLPVLVGWSTEDEDELIRLKNMDINMLEAFLSRYAVLQKKI